jgi:hypothetical protein
MQTRLTGSTQTTYDAVFQHPIARNLKWVDVRALLISLADAVQEHGDVLEVTRSGKCLVLRRPSRSGMDDIAALMRIRSFLERIATATTETESEMARKSDGSVKLTDASRS